MADVNPLTQDLTCGNLDFNKEFCNLVCFNTNGILNKIEQLRSYILELNLAVIGICESKLSSTTAPSAFALANYSCISKPRNQHGGGLLLYIRNDIPFHRIIALESKVIEHISIDIMVMKQVLNINLFYRPPRNDSISTTSFLCNMEKTLNDINCHTCSNSILFGDFNLGNIYEFYGSLLNKPLDIRANELFERHNWIQTIDRATRIEQLSVSLIDLIYVKSMINFCKTAIIPPVANADHFGILISFKLHFNPQQPKFITKYDYNKGDWTALKNFLKNFYFPANTSPDAKTNLLTNTLIQARQLFIPHTTFLQKNRDVPWMNSEIRRLLRKKNRLHKLYCKAANKLKQVDLTTDADTLTSMSNRVYHRMAAFKNASKIYNRKCRAAKVRYFHNLKSVMSDPSMSSRKKFDLLKKVSSTDLKETIPPLCDGDSIVHGPKEKANLLNMFFCSKSHINGYSDPSPDLEKSDTIPSLKQFNTSPFEIGPIIKNLKNSNFSPCGVPAAFLKEIYLRTGTHICKLISQLFNDIFDKGTFPSQWKRAQVTAIIKSGDKDKTDKSSYRPISILATLSKMCESIIHNWLLSHFLTNNIITPCQSAYLPGDSTAQQLINMIHKIKTAWSEKKIARAVFLDVSSAFDAVWHNALLQKLSQCGIDCKAFEVIQSYLSDRKMVTSVDGILSDEVTLFSGVPQGSCLGPLLFILYLNDIVQGLISYPLIYADDCTLLAVGDTLEEVTSILNNDLKQISAWADKWKTKFNPSKSVSLTFSKSPLHTDVPVLMNNVHIESCNSHKHLGVILTSNLSWDLQVKQIIRKANFKLSYMWSINQLSRQTLDIIYKIHIRPCIDYAIQAFGSSLTRDNLKKLDSLQYRAACIVTGALKFTSKEKLLTELGWESNTERFDFLMLCHFHKIVLYQTRANIRPCMPQPLISNYPNRHRRFSRYKYTNTDFEKSFFPYILEKWESLDPKLKMLGDMVEFKTQLSLTFKPKRYRHFRVGSKNLNSHHTQLRVGRTLLNSHQFAIGLSPTPGCLCGATSESVEHFLLDCFLYANERTTLLGKLENLTDVKLKNLSKSQLLQIMLFGESIDNPEKYHHNKQIFISVQNFLRTTKRLFKQSPMQLRI